MASNKRKLLIGALSIIGIAVIIMIICDYIVADNASGKNFDEIDQLPKRKVGLVLGTSPISTFNGRRNIYYDYRIKAAAELIKNGKVDTLVVSGGDYSDSCIGFDEPVCMRDSLIKLGVDSARILLDYDGTRTIKSIANIRDVYHKDSIIIVSQKYHNERALYQAKHLGVNAIAYNAHTPGRRLSWWRNRGREVLARVKLFIDIARTKN